MSTQCSDYRVGWLCVKDIELTASIQMLDEQYTGDKKPEINSSRDANSYTFGRIKELHVVMAALPEGCQGKSEATRTTERMMTDFPNIDIRLMTGIAGGAPTAKNQMRLGDIVISIPTKDYAGVLQYDYGQTIQNQDFACTGHVNKPPTNLLNAVTLLKANFKTQGHKLAETVQDRILSKSRLTREFSKPDKEDILYKPHYDHNKQHLCDCLANDQKIDFRQHSNMRVTRPSRTAQEDDPKVHYGLIASADNVMRDAITRDKLAAKYEVLCFEMEAAGVMNGLSTLIIRGISDYADSHKNDDWQGYAAAMAAAYARALLVIMSGNRTLSIDLQGLTITNNAPWSAENARPSRRGLPIVGWHNINGVNSTDGLADEHQEMVLQLQSRRRSKCNPDLVPWIDELRENKTLFAQGIDYWSYMTLEGYNVYRKMYDIMYAQGNRRDILWFATCLGNAAPEPKVLMALWERFRYDPLQHEDLPGCFILALLYMLHVEVFSDQICHEKPEMDRKSPRELDWERRKMLKSSLCWVKCTSPEGCSVRWNFMSQQWGIPCNDGKKVPQDCLEYQRYREREVDRHVPAGETVPTPYSDEKRKVMDGIHKELRNKWYADGWREQKT